MPQETPFDEKMRAIIAEYVEAQDLHALETPLKSEQEIKKELQNKLTQQQNFTTITKGFINAVQLINNHLQALNDEQLIQKVKNELEKGLMGLAEFFRKGLPAQQSLEGSFWSSVYGISDETLVLIYDVFLECYKNRDISNAKDVLQILLIFAPTIPAYWNALGFCYQAEGNLEKALVYYLIAQEIDEDQIETYFYLTRCYLALNNKSLAKEQTEKLVKLISASSEKKNKWGNAIKQLLQDVNS